MTTFNEILNSDLSAIKIAEKLLTIKLTTTDINTLIQKKNLQY